MSSESRPPPRPRSATDGTGGTDGTDGTDATEIPPHPCGRPDVVYRRLGEEWVLFDPDGRRLHVLNLTAALVWQSCDGSRTVSDIVDEVRGAFPDPPGPERIRADVTTALSEMAELGLLLDGAPEA